MDVPHDLGHVALASSDVASCLDLNSLESLVGFSHEVICSGFQGYRNYVSAIQEPFGGDAQPALSAVFHGIPEPHLHTGHRLEVTPVTKMRSIQAEPLSYGFDGLSPAAGSFAECPHNLGPAGRGSDSLLELVIRIGTPVSHNKHAIS